MEINTTGYLKDSRTNAVINLNEQEWERFKAQRDQQRTIDTLQDQYNKLSEMVSQLLQSKAKEQ